MWIPHGLPENLLLLITVDCLGRQTGLESLLAQGLSERVIARRLGITRHQVRALKARRQAFSQAADESVLREQPYAGQPSSEILADNQDHPGDHRQEDD